MSLAQELLDDLNDVSADDNAGSGAESSSAKTPHPTDTQEFPSTSTSLGFSSLAEPLDDSQLNYDAIIRTLSKIDVLKAKPGVSLSPDYYSGIIDASNTAAEIESEMALVHKKLKDAYAPRFLDLESLVPEPVMYARVIRVLGNDEELHLHPLDSLLPAGAVMTIKMTAATSKALVLDSAAWHTVDFLCTRMLDLERLQGQIHQYIESQMLVVAPNVSAIVGTSTATKLLGAAGSLENLTLIPACNLFLLGAQKKAHHSLGLSTAYYSADRKHTGFIFDSPIVQGVRLEDRMKAQEKVAGKVALAARIDLARSYPSGEYGVGLVDKLYDDFNRLATPPPRKINKPLPRPEEKKKRHRGGQRARKAREAYAQTELQKLRNRVQFNQPEGQALGIDEEDGLGLLGSSSGHVRGLVADPRTKAKLTKANRKYLEKFS